MKKIICIVIIVFNFSCNEKKTVGSTFDDKFLDLIIDESNGETIEFPELYDKLSDKLLEDKDERLILVEKLKLRGFEVVNYGRGNFPPLGSRIVIVEMQNKDCECVISKKYYFTISKGIYLTAESISCKKIK